MIPETIVYLLKVNAALLLFYAGYYFILRRYTFYIWNRLYLMLAIAFSALYPFADISGLLNNNQVVRQQIDLLTPSWNGSVRYVMSQSQSQNNLYRDVPDVLIILFWTGVFILFTRLVARLCSLLILHLQTTPGNLDGFRFRKVSERINPFSFWNNIYLNPDCHEANELSPILQHEQVHIRQFHTTDVLLAELCTVLCWFNPAAWLIRRAVKANLEYITDQEVIRSGFDRKAYQYALLKIHVLPQNPLPVNNFHFLTIKKRIIMMNKKPSRKIGLGGYLLILPSILLSLTLINSSYANLKWEMPADTDAVMSAIRVPFKETAVIEAAGRADTSEIKIRRTETVEAFIGAAHAASDTVKGEPIYLLDGVEVVRPARRISPDSIHSITVVKGIEAETLYGAKAKNGVVAITSKSAAAQGNETPLSIARTITPRESQKISLDAIGDALIILNGQEASKAELSLLTVSKIQSIEVVKGAAAAQRYGEKGSKGVVVVTTN